MREAVAADSDVALARMLGVSDSTVAMWKKRQSIPYAEAVRVANETGSSISYLLTGVGRLNPVDAVLSVPNEEVISAVLRTLVRLKLLTVNGKGAAERKASVEAASREFFIYYRNALNTLHELTAKHGMDGAEALRLIVRNLDPE